MKMNFESIYYCIYFLKFALFNVLPFLARCICSVKLLVNWALREFSNFHLILGRLGVEWAIYFELGTTLFKTLATILAAISWVISVIRHRGG